jgi:F0F1-type ATP synthase membrane subunit b/b'
MASQTITKILAAEQAAAEAVAGAQAQAEKIIETAQGQARRTLEEEAAKTAADVRGIADAAGEEVARINRQAEQDAREKARALREEAMGRLESAQGLVVSMIIPE